jgi:hypothetical protein
MRVESVLRSDVVLERSMRPDELGRFGVDEQDALLDMLWRRRLPWVKGVLPRNSLVFSRESPR